MDKLYKPIPKALLYKLIPSPTRRASLIVTRIAHIDERFSLLARAQDHTALAVTPAAD